MIGSTVLVGDLGGQARGLDVATGEVRWTQTFDTHLPATTSAVGNTAFVVAGTTVTAVDPQTGAERWRLTTAAFNSFATAPIAAGDLVVTATDRALYAVDPADGTVLWQAEAPDGLFNAPPVAAADRVLITADSGLVAFDVTDGHRAWTLPFHEGEGGWTPPTVSGDRAFLSVGARLVALDLASGKEWWSLPAPEGEQLNESPTVAGDRVFVTDGHLYALDAGTGELLWTSDAVDPASSAAVASTPVIAGDLLLVPAGDGLYAVDQATGALGWRLGTTASLGVGVPTVTGDQVVVLAVSMTGSVAHGVDPVTGSDRWQVEVPGEAHLTAPVPAGDGLVLLPGRDALVAVR